MKIKNNKRNCVSGRKVIAMTTACAMTLSMAGTAFAGSWQQNGTGWSWMKDNGQKAVNEWQQSASGGWYHFNQAGDMETGFLNQDGQRYYLEQDAATGVQGMMSKGWKQVNGRWYFFLPAATAGVNVPEGGMLTGWQWIDGKCYYFEPAAGENQGVMYAGTVTPDGSSVGADGVWTEGGVAVYMAGKGISTVAAPTGAGAVGLASVSASGINAGGGSSSGGGGGASSGGGSSSSGSSSNRIDQEWEDYDDNISSYSGSSSSSSGTDYYMTSGMRREVNDVIDQFKSEYIKAGMTDFEKELQIIQYIVENCSYEKADDSSRATSYACLVRGKAQCCGYASAFLDMAKACGLTVNYVVSKTHAWNQIKLDGKWYHVDVTWEDPIGSNDYGVGNMRNKYINLEDAEIRQIVHHKSWTPSSNVCNSHDYGPDVVSHYLKTGEVDLSKGEVFSDKANAVIEKYMKDDKSNVFEITDAADGAEKVYQYLKPMLQNKNINYDYVLNLPKKYNKNDSGSYSRMTAVSREIASKVNERINSEFSDRLKTPVNIYHTMCNYGDGTFAFVYSGKFVYQPVSLNYTVSWIDESGNTLRTDSGTTMAGETLKFTTPDGYIYDSTKTEANKNISIYTLSTIVKITPKEAYRKDFDVVIQVRKKAGKPAKKPVTLIASPSNMEQ